MLYGTEVAVCSEINTRISQIFYLVIYWAQKVHNDFILLCNIVLPPAGHSSNRIIIETYKTLEMWFEFLSHF